MVLRRSNPGKHRAGTPVKAGTSRRAAAHRRALFVEALIQNGGNQTRAAEAVGFKCGKAAEQAGYRLSKDVWVSKELARRRADEAVKEKLTSNEVQIDQARALRFDPRKLFREDGKTLKDVSELDDDTALALTSIEVTQKIEGRGKDRKVVIRTTKIKWLDKNVVRDQANKFFGHYREDNKQRSDPEADMIAWVREKNEASGTHGLPVKY